MSSPRIHDKGTCAPPLPTSDVKRWWGLGRLASYLAVTAVDLAQWPRGSGSGGYFSGQERIGRIGELPR